MTLAAGLLALLTGLAYTGLAGVTAYEMVHHRERGFTQFGAAFFVMASTCGPHHLLHAVRHLSGSEMAHGPHLAALALGVVPAVVFVGLRLEQQAMPELRDAIAHCETVRDYISRELFEDILESEEEHVDFLETQFELIKRVGLENYIQLQSESVS